MKLDISLPTGTSDAVGNSYFVGGISIVAENVSTNSSAFSLEATVAPSKKDHFIIELNKFSIMWIFYSHIQIKYSSQRKEEISK